MTIKDRIETANDFVKIISEHGRRFFHYEGRVGKFEVRRGHVYWICEYKQKPIYLSYRYWRFHHGGTLRALVNCLADYIRGKGNLPVDHIGPWRESLCGGDLWGYGVDEMQTVRDRIKLLTETQVSQ